MISFSSRKWLSLLLIIFANTSFSQTDGHCRYTCIVCRVVFVSWFMNQCDKTWTLSLRSRFTSSLWCPFLPSLAGTSCYGWTRNLNCLLYYCNGTSLSAVTVKVAVVRIALIATFALRPNWSQAIHDDPYKLYISEQVCVWSMCWHQRSPPFSNIWGCYSHQHGRGIKIKNWISCVFIFFFIKNIKSLVTWL